MFQFIEFLRKRPSDATIRATRFLFAVAVALLLGLAHASYSLPFADRFGEANATYVQYALAAFALIPGIVAAAGCCVAKRKYVRIAQIVGAILLFVIAAAITPTGKTVAPTATAQSGSVSASDLVKNTAPESAPVNVARWLTILAFLPLLSGITGKMVTEKCLKYGETITKIRV